LTDLRPSHCGDGKRQVGSPGSSPGPSLGPGPVETENISQPPWYLAPYERTEEPVPCLTPTENSSKLPGMIRICCRVALWFTLLLAAALEPRILPAYQPASPDYLQLNGLSGRRGGNLVVAVNADPSSFNRVLTALFAHTTVTDRISADLVHINRATMELEPALAKSWEVSADGRSYTIHLRRGLRFSDGSPFSADDVLFTFQVLQDPKTGAYLAGQVEVDGGFPQITKIDQYTVRLVYQRPVGMGLRSLDSVPILPFNGVLQRGNSRFRMGPGYAPRRNRRAGSVPAERVPKGRKDRPGAKSLLLEEGQGGPDTSLPRHNHLSGCARPQFRNDAVSGRRDRPSEFIQS
jgi:hypothetical protein